MGARDVRGRHRDHVGGRAGLGDGGSHTGRSEEVDLDGLRQGSIEGNGGGRVDDHVRGRQGGATFVVEPEPVAADIAGDGADPACHLRVEVVAQLGAQAVEAVVLDHLSGEPGGRVRSAPRSYEDRHLGLGDAADDALDQSCAQEAGGAGYEEAFPTEIPLNGHRNCLAPPVESVYHLVSAQLVDQRPHPGRCAGLLRQPGI